MIWVIGHAALLLAWILVAALLHEPRDGGTPI